MMSYKDALQLNPGDRVVVDCQEEILLNAKIKGWQVSVLRLGLHDRKGNKRHCEFGTSRKSDKRERSLPFWRIP